MNVNFVLLDSLAHFNSKTLWGMNSLSSYGNTLETILVGKECLRAIAERHGTIELSKVCMLPVEMPQSLQLQTITMVPSAKPLKVL